MVVIRFQRRGKKHQPTFRIVADNKRSKLDGAFLEDLGWYNPHSKEVGLKAERIQYWLSVGARPSDTVHNLLISNNVLEGKKISVHKKSKKTEEEIKAEAAKKVAAEEKKEALPVIEEKAEETKNVLEESKEDTAEPAPTEETKPEAEKSE